MIFYIAILSVFLSVVVALNNWRVNKASLFLSALMFLLSIFIVHLYAATDGGSVFWMAVMYNNFSYTYYLGGPLLLWYTRALIEDEVHFRKYDWLHLVPFLINFTGVVPYILTSFDYKMQVAEALLRDLNYAEVIQYEINWVMPMKFNAFIRNVSMISYSGYSILLFIRHLRQSVTSEVVWNFQKQHVQRWFFLFSGIFLMIGITNMITAIQYAFLGGPAVTLYHYPTVLINSIMIACLPMLLIAFPHIIYGLPRHAAKPEETKQPVTSEPAPQRSAADEKAYFNLLAERIIKIFEEEKPFLQVNYSIEDLAARLQVPRHHLYFCLNTVIGKKFAGLRNHYRILHAQQLLKDMDMNRYTIDSISLQSGFASRSNFYSTFKEVTGQTPTEFLRERELGDGSFSAGQLAEG